MHGRSLVFQSCDPAKTTPWLAICLDSVAQWAAARGHGYRRIGNALFDPLPDGFAAACAGRRLPMSDLARLLWCRRLLTEGWDQVLWIDSDVLVTAPAAFAVEAEGSESLCRELWLWREEGQIRARWAVNNCVMAWRAGSAVLDYYIHACTVLADAEEGPGALGLGPGFLTRLDAAAPLPQIDSVMTLSPLLIEAVLDGDAALLANARTLWAAPIHAVHLCASLSGQGGPALTAGADYARVVEALQSGTPPNPIF